MGNVPLCGFRPADDRLGDRIGPCVEGDAWCILRCRTTEKHGRAFFIGRVASQQSTHAAKVRFIDRAKEDVGISHTRTGYEPLRRARDLHSGFVSPPPR